MPAPLTLPAATMPEPTSQQFTAKTIYLRLIRYAWKHWQVFLLGILAMGVLSATNTGFLSAIKNITDNGFVHPDPAKLRILP
jgi:subfamily B ATP-binding cassette protein MsbA